MAFGEITGVFLEDNSGWVVKGWVHDSDNPKSPIKIIVYCDGKPLGLFDVGRLASDADHAPSLAAKKFSMKVPDVFLDGEEHVMRFFAGEPAKELTWQTSNVFKLQPFYGAVDPLKGNVLSGWAINGRRTDRTTNIEIEVDGVWLASLVCNEPRPHGTGLDSGKACGFSYRLPASIFDGKDHVVSVLFSNLNSHLDGSPVLGELSKIVSNIEKEGLRYFCSNRDVMEDVRFHEEPSASWHYENFGVNEQREAPSSIRPVSSLQISPEGAGVIQCGELVARSVTGDGPHRQVRSALWLRLQDAAEITPSITVLGMDVETEAAVLGFPNTDPSIFCIFATADLPAMADASTVGVRIVRKDDPSCTLAVSADTELCCGVNIPKNVTSHFLMVEGWLMRKDRDACSIFVLMNNVPLPVEIHWRDEAVDAPSAWPDPAAFPVVWWTGLVDVSRYPSGPASMSVTVLRQSDGAVRHLKGATVTVSSPTRYAFPETRAKIGKLSSRLFGIAILDGGHCDPAPWESALGTMDFLGTYPSIEALMAQDWYRLGSDNLVVLIPHDPLPPDRALLSRKISDFADGEYGHNLMVPSFDDLYSQDGTCVLARRSALDLIVEPDAKAGQDRRPLLLRLSNDQLSVCTPDSGLVLHVEHIRRGDTPAEHLVIEGWVACKGEEFPVIELSGPTGPLPLHLTFKQRQDVWHHFPDHARSLSTGFIGTVGWKDLAVGFNSYVLRGFAGPRSTDTALQGVEISPLIGQVEQPGDGAEVDAKLLFVRGWAVSHDEAAIRVLATDGWTAREIPVDWVQRPDVARHVGCPSSMLLGFQGFLDIEGMDISQLIIRMCSETGIAERILTGLTVAPPRAEIQVQNPVWIAGTPRVAIRGNVAARHSDVQAVVLLANDRFYARTSAVRPVTEVGLSGAMPLGMYSGFHLEADLSDLAGQTVTLSVVAYIDGQIHQLTNFSVTVPKMMGADGDRLRFSVDSPHEGEMIAENTPIPVTGWVLQLDGHPLTIRAYVDDTLVYETEALLKRVDVDQAYNLPADKRSKGFRFVLPWQLQAGGELTIRLTCHDTVTEETAEIGQRRVFGVPAAPLTDSRLSRWLEANALNHRSEEDARALMAGWTVRPKVSIIMPHYRAKPEWLDRALESVDAQWYRNFELCIADDGSGDPAYAANLRRLADCYPWIALTFCEKNGGIASASNAATGIASGDFILFLDQDDAISPNCLFEFVKLLQDEPDLDILYSDCCKIDQLGRLFDLTFKPDYDPDMLLSYMYLNHALMIRRSLFEKAGRFHAGFDGSQDFELALRLVEQTRRIAHVPAVLYHWRVLPGSTALAGDEKPESFDAGIRAVQAALDRRGLSYRAVDRSDFAVRSRAGFYRIVWDAPEKPPVSIIIPTHNQMELLRTCIDSIEQVSTYSNYEIVIVDDRSDDPATLDYLRGLRHTVVTVPDRGQGFNFSALINAGAEAAGGDYLLLLNNDIEIVTPGWLEEMLGWARQPGVGTVGCRLLFPGGHVVQHAGLVMRLREDSPGHLFRGEPAYSGGYYGWSQIARGVSAVTFAAAMIPRAVFDELGGLDADEFPVAYQDPDFCMRARAAGYRIVYTAHAELIHHESVSKPRTFKDSADRMRFHLRWPDPDPMFNPNLVGLGETPAATDRRVHLTAPEAKVRVAALVHNMRLQGAPTSQLLILRGLALRHGFDIHVLAVDNGPLFESYREFAASITRLDGPSTGWSQQATDWLEVVGPDLVYANTLETEWFVSAALALGHQPFWNIRESAVPSTFFGARTPRTGMAERCLAESGRIAFVAEATANLFRNARLAMAPVLTIRNGVDLAEFRPRSPDDTVRDRLSQYGIPPDAVVIGTVGTICPRKAQHLAIRAFIEVQKMAPNLPIWFISLGETPPQQVAYGQMVRNIIAEAPHPERILLLPEDRAVAEWYRCFDVFILAALEESFPRVVIEAMASGLPVVSSNVFGIAEQVIDGDTGFPFDPGDVEGMAGALWRLSLEHPLRTRMGKRGRFVAEKLYGIDRMVDAYAKEFRLLREELG